MFRNFIIDSIMTIFMSINVLNISSVSRFVKDINHISSDIEFLNFLFYIKKSDIEFLYFRNGIFAGVELEYDRFSRLTSWKWGDLSESYSFDRAGRLSEIRYGDGSAMIYAFKDMFSSLVSKYTAV
jgi:hypothetical protein